MIAEKSGVLKILVDEDFVKAPIYEAVRVDPSVSSLITERDKALYRQKVSRGSALPHVPEAEFT